MAAWKQYDGTGEMDCLQCYGSGRHGNYPTQKNARTVVRVESKPAQCVAAVGKNSIIKRLGFSFY